MNDERKDSRYTKPDRIESLRKKLYSVTGVNRKGGSDDLRSGTPVVPTDWEYEGGMGKQKQKSVLNSLFWGALIFFIIAAGFAFLSLQRGFNSVSPDNILVTVSGPQSIDAGEVLELEVRVKNNNDVDMEGAVLFIEYPDGTRAVDDLDTPLVREQIDLNTISKGQHSDVLLDAILFGSEGAERVIEFSVQYGIAGSDATFSKKDSYTLEISSSPVSVSVDAPGDIRSGETFSVSVEVESKSDEVIQDVLLVADYPAGFQFVDEGTSPTFDEHVWLLGDMPAGSKKTITFKGKVFGQQGDERAIRFEVGTQSPRNEKVVGTPFLVYASRFTLERPLLALSLSANGTTGSSYTMNANDQVRVEVVWRNNTGEDVRDGEVSVRLRGDFIDPDSISIEGGQYQKSTNTLTWNGNTDTRLRRIDDGASTNLSFTFKALPAAELVSGSFDPEMVVEASLKAQGLDTRERFTSEDTQTIFLGSSIGIRAYGDFNGGPFSNSGPLPPQEGQTTTYTITFDVSNTVNEAGDVIVRATLPSYVSWRSEVSPSARRDEVFTEGNDIIWELGDVDASTSKKLQFQIGVTPEDYGESLPLVEDIVIEAVDLYTGETVESSAPDIVLTLGS